MSVRGMPRSKRFASIMTSPRRTLEIQDTITAKASPICMGEAWQWAERCYGKVRTLRGRM